MPARVSRTLGLRRDGNARMVSGLRVRVSYCLGLHEVWVAYRMVIACVVFSGDLFIFSPQGHEVLASLYFPSEFDLLFQVKVLGYNSRIPVISKYILHPRRTDSRPLCTVRSSDILSLGHTYMYSEHFGRRITQQVFSTKRVANYNFSNSQY